MTATSAIPKMRERHGGTRKSPPQTEGGIHADHETELGGLVVVVPGTALEREAAVTALREGQSPPLLFLGALISVELLWLCAVAYLILRFVL